MDVHGCQVVRFAEIGGLPRSNVENPYRNCRTSTDVRWTSTDVKLNFHIETSGRPGMSSLCA